MKYIKKVIAVSWMPCNKLTSLHRIAVNAVNAPASPDWEKIPIEVPGELNISSKDDEKNKIWTAKLVFRTCNSNFNTYGHQAFLVTLANSERIIIGNSERPYPTINTEENLTAGNSDSQLKAVTIAWSTNEEIPYLR